MGVKDLLKAMDSPMQSERMEAQRLLLIESANLLRDIAENGGVCVSATADDMKELVAAASRFMEASSYLCLKKHVEPPTEEGEYLYYSKAGYWWNVQGEELVRDMFVGVTDVAYGPLPKGGVS